MDDQMNRLLTCDLEAGECPCFNRLIFLQISRPSIFQDFLILYINNILIAIHVDAKASELAEDLVKHGFINPVSFKSLWPRGPGPTHHKFLNHKIPLYVVKILFTKPV